MLCPLPQIEARGALFMSFEPDDVERPSHVLLDNTTLSQRDRRLTFVVGNRNWPDDSCFVFPLPMCSTKTLYGIGWAKKVIKASTGPLGPRKAPQLDNAVALVIPDNNNEQISLQSQLCPTQEPSLMLSYEEKETP